MKTLYTYQKQAKDAIQKAVRNGATRALIVMATGLGKTVVASAVLRWWRRTRGTSVLFLVHLWEAVDQAEREFREALGSKAEIQILAGPAQLNKNADVVLSTFQTMRKRYKRMPKNTFGLVLVDEAHRGKASTYEPVVEHFDADLRLGMTATPDRMDGRDIRDLFGEEVYSYPLAKALADRQLADVEYRVLMDNVSLSALRKIMRRIGKGDRRVSRDMIDREVFLKERLESIVKIVRKEQKKRRQTIIFCRSRKHANAVSKHFPEARTYYAGLPGPVLKERFIAFKLGELKTLIVVNKLNEAVDVPDADLVVFLRMTESITIWMQQLGRGLRKVLGKDNVLVLDFVANCDRIREVRQLVSEMRRHLGVSDDVADVYTAGIDFNFDASARDVLTVLERIERDFYPTLREAQEAAWRIGFKTRRHYQQGYKQDPRLPAQPSKFYENDWTSWPNFLYAERYRKVRNPYATFKEAKAAVRRLGIETFNEYLQRYSEDPRLPATPYRTYADEWVSWSSFLGNKRANRYPSLLEAKNATRKLKLDPKSRSEYQRRCTEDPRLPTNPHRVYSDEWVSWANFLGKRGLYSTLADARRATRRLEIQTRTEYNRRYKEDPRLPSSPHVRFKNEWISWWDFLGKRSPKTNRSKPKKKKAKRKPKKKK